MALEAIRSPPSVTGGRSNPPVPSRRYKRQACEHLRLLPPGASFFKCVSPLPPATPSRSSFSWVARAPRLIENEAENVFGSPRDNNPGRPKEVGVGVGRRGGADVVRCMAWEKEESSEKERTRLFSVGTPLRAPAINVVVLRRSIAIGKNQGVKRCHLKKLCAIERKIRQSGC